MSVLNKKIVNGYPVEYFNNLNIKTFVAYDELISDNVQIKQRDPNLPIMIHFYKNSQIRMIVDAIFITPENTTIENGIAFFSKKHLDYIFFFMPDKNGKMQPKVYLPNGKLWNPIIFNIKKFLHFYEI